MSKSKSHNRIVYDGVFLLFITLIIMLVFVGHTFAYFTSQENIENLYDVASVEFDSFVDDDGSDLTMPLTYTYDGSETVNQTVSVTNNNDIDVYLRYKTVVTWDSNEDLRFDPETLDLTTTVDFEYTDSDWAENYIDVETENGTVELPEYNYYNHMVSPNDTVELVNGITFPTLGSSYDDDDVEIRFVVEAMQGNSAGRNLYLSGEASDVEPAPSSWEFYE
ncbi:MAG: SipW-dependent-type signal peptide-containing protein [Candidatus Woesearchaeota archaeon]